MAYFKKEQVGHPIYLPGGRKVQFVDVDGDIGVLATEDQTVVLELRKSIGRLGIVEISSETYTELKKKAESTRSVSNSKQPTDRSLQALLGRNGAVSALGSRVNVVARSSLQAPSKAANPTAPLTTTPEIIKPARPLVAKPSDLLGAKANP